MFRSIDGDAVVALNSIHATADVDEHARLGTGLRIWNLAKIREDAVIGDGCTVGCGAYIGPGVVLGRNCKVQNQALVYEPARLGDGVFLGPGVVLTNDEFPRAVNPDGSLKTEDDWTHVGVDIGTGASVGARAVCVAPVTIGAWAMIAAGAVVTADVPAYALVVGVPARQIGWVGEAGHRLIADGDGDCDSDGGLWICPATGRRYAESDSGLEPVP